MKQGKQRVTARSHDAADAIEKTITVHPYGQEKIQTLSQVFLGKAADGRPNSRRHGSGLAGRRR